MGPSRGRLKVWKADRGFGFIAPDDGSRDAFLHVRDLGRIARPPRVGDVVHYQPIDDGIGRRRAGDARIEGLDRLPDPLSPPRRRRQRPARRRAAPRRRRWAGRVTLVVGIFVAAVVVGARWLPVPAELRPRTSVSQPAPSAPSASERFVCDGRIYCSEMRSCAEATFFLARCPGTTMDGDGDGIPCERQWCD